MKTDTAGIARDERVLRLTLLAPDPSALAARLSRKAALARLMPTQRQLYIVHFDTPDNTLARQHYTLQLQRAGAATKAHWQQILTLDEPDSRMPGRRCTWSAPVPGPHLRRSALDASPWQDIDPDGVVFDTLEPCFVIKLQCTEWQVRRPDGSMVAVVFETGRIEAGGQDIDIAELQLVLQSGTPTTLFEIARQIARGIAVLPQFDSPAQRGFDALTQQIPQARYARALRLRPDDSLPGSAQRVLGEMFCQFSTNLNTMLRSDQPEVVHQARVGWRRLRAAKRLFCASLPQSAGESSPPWENLQPLLTFLGALRDLDVARHDTLPRLAQAYTASDASRTAALQFLNTALGDAARVQRKAVRYALRKTAVGSTLLAIAQWLEALGTQAGDAGERKHKKSELRRWARERMEGLHARMEHTLEEGRHDPEKLHRARILAKRLRYGIELLKPLLPRRRAQTWYRQAIELQTNLGTLRDVTQAVALATELGAEPGLVDFLRGVVTGHTALHDPSG